MILDEVITVEDSDEAEAPAPEPAPTKSNKRTKKSKTLQPLQQNVRRSSRHASKVGVVSDDQESAGSRVARKRKATGQPSDEALFET